MRLLLTIMLLCTLASCATRRKLEKTESKTATRSDTLRITVKETIRLDTVMLPGNIVTVVQKFPCDSTAEKPGKPDTAKRGNVRLITQNLGNGMQRIDCIADSLVAVIAARDREIETYKASKKQDVQVVTEKQVVTKYRTAWWWYVLLVGYVGWLCRNPLISIWQKLRKRRQGNGTAD